MHIICLTPLEAGVYNDHKADNITAPPEGWAYIPDDFPLPSTFPRLGGIEAEEMTYTREIDIEKDGKTVTEQREYTMMTVTAMTEGTLPEPVGPELLPTVEELAEENKLLKMQIEAQSEQMDFYEDCIAEMASVVYA